MKIVISPSGAGKSHFVKNLTERNADEVRDARGRYFTVMRGGLEIQVIDGDTLPAIRGVYKQLTSCYGSKWWERPETEPAKAAAMTPAFRTLMKLNRKFILTAETAPLFVNASACVFVIPTVVELVENTRMRGAETGQPVWTTDKAVETVNRYITLSRYTSRPVYRSFDMAFEVMLGADFRKYTVKEQNCKRQIENGGVL